MPRSKTSTAAQSTETLGDLADSLFTLRGEKAKIAERLKEIEGVIDQTEAKFIAKCKEQGTTVASGQLAQVSFKSVVIPKADDWAKISQYIIRHKATQLLQRRLSTSAYDELVAQGKTVPGVSTISIERVHITGK